MIEDRERDESDKPQDRSEPVRCVQRRPSRRRPAATVPTGRLRGRVATRAAGGGAGLTGCVVFEEVEVENVVVVRAH